VYSVVEKYHPDEIYNLAAQSHVGTSFSQPDYTFQTNTMGPLNFLEAICRFSPDTKFYQASTSELFGKNYNVDKDGKKYQDEKTKFMPQSPYAIAKLAAHDLVRIYREGRRVHASCGILFNHESPRRGENFVTRKITKWLGEFYKWRMNHEEAYTFDDDNIISDHIESFPKLRLGNLDAYRDWGHAADYVFAMYLMMQKDPDDYVISTGETHSIRDFLREAFKYVGIDNFEPYVVVDPQFYRPTEVEHLCGRSDKAKRLLDWSPQYSFSDLVKIMVRSDIDGEEKVEAKTLYQEEL